MPLIRIVYYSERNRLVGLDMRALLDVCERNNMRDEIGGFLHYNGLYFLQALEGEQAIVGACYRRILADNHHNNIVLLGAEFVDGRMFGTWAMELAAGAKYPSKEVFEANFATSTIDPALLSGMVTPSA